MYIVGVYYEFPTCYRMCKTLQNQFLEFLQEIDMDRKSCIFKLKPQQTPTKINFSSYVDYAGVYI